MAHRLSCSAACGLFPDQGSNPCPLHWQADSQPLRHQGSPGTSVLMVGFGQCAAYIEHLFGKHCAKLLNQFCFRGLGLRKKKKRKRGGGLGIRNLPLKFIIEPGTEDCYPNAVRSIKEDVNL